MAHPLAQDLDHILRHTRVWELLRGRNIFITGGTGFVGTWLVESLVWANERLGLNTRLLLLTRDPAAFFAKAPASANHNSVHFLRGAAESFCFPEGDFPIVIHASTHRYFDATSQQPTSVFDIEVEGTRRVLNFARTHGTERFLFTSSGAVYGEQPPELTHIPEDYRGAPFTTDSNSAYGQAKRASEFLCTMYAQQFGFAAVIARLFAFSGPHLPLDLNFAIGNFIRDVLSGGPVRIAGDGTPYRSYLYAADLVVWLLTLLIEGKSARPYNVGSARAVTIAELARAVVENTVTEMPIKIARKPIPGVPSNRYVPCVDRARAELALEPLISLDDGIRRMFAWNQVLAGVPSR
jgi:dTDP-glucose 4,6-dehydratase